MVKPILLYGSEILVYQRRKCIESVQIQFCKFLLNLGSHTSNDASLDECGRYNLYVDSLLKYIYNFGLRLYTCQMIDCLNLHMICCMEKISMVKHLGIRN